MAKKTNLIERLIAEERALLPVIRLNGVRERIARCDQKQLTEWRDKLTETLKEISTIIMEIFDDAGVETIKRASQIGAWDEIKYFLDVERPRTKEAVRAAVKKILDGKKRFPNRPRSMSTRIENREITSFVVSAVKGGRSADGAYQDAAEKFDMNKRSIERICAVHAKHIVRTLAMEELCAGLRDAIDMIDKALEEPRS